MIDGLIEIACSKLGVLQHLRAGLDRAGAYASLLEEIHRLTLGMLGGPAFELDAYPGEPLTCTVKSITPVASIKGEQSLRRAFVVVLELPKTDPRMRPGMSVKVELHGAPIAGATVVPRGAVVFGKQVKARLADGSLRDVTIGACDAQGCVVEQGLVAGEAVQL